MHFLLGDPRGSVAFGALAAALACGRVGDSSLAAAGGSPSGGGVPSAAGSSSGGTDTVPAGPSGGVSGSGSSGSAPVASGGNSHSGGRDNRGGASGATAAGASGSSSTGGSPSSGGTASGGKGGEGGEVTGGSCAGVSATCGPTASSDCCLSNMITGGTFKRSNDSATPATIADFRLDTYELTVGGFRKFVEAYPGSRPAAGSGKNPTNPSDQGWDVKWPLPADRAALLRALRCGEANLAWSDAAGPSENLPMNCVRWYEAFAFCIWDGGRLPTEAEWNYAAAGGAEQRVYPWSTPPQSRVIDSGYAFYNEDIGTKPIRVGSKSPKGDGKWGSADLAGNLWEWTRDALLPYPMPCDNCFSEVTSDPWRPIRGGGIYNPGEYVKTLDRSPAWATTHYGDIGARCARDL